MKAIYKQPGKDAEIIQIPNSLSALQKAVGGYIEAVTVTTDAVILCNEEGRLKEMPHNVNFLGFDFVGPILIVGQHGERFADVQDTEFWMEVLRNG